MKVILQYRVNGPYIYDMVMHLHKITAKRKLPLNGKKRLV